MPTPLPTSDAALFARGLGANERRAVVQVPGPDATGHTRGGRCHRGSP
jgi:hypothetical protein